MAIRNGTALNDSFSPISKQTPTSNINQSDIVYGFDGNDTINYSTSLADNDLFGGNGNDTLTGGAGHDYLDGGNDNDKLTGGAGSDDLLGGAGIDTLVGGDGNDNLNGGADNDTLTGGNGIDRFIVANNSADTIKDLGAGQDSLYVDAGSIANATVVAAWTATGQTANNGIANIKSTGFNVDLSKAKGSAGFNVTLAGTTGAIATGSDNDDTLTGGAGVDVIYGKGGNDTISGGTQGDTMYGGLGNDTFIVDNIGDTVVEYAGEGTDLVQSKVSYTLSAEVENLTLTGTASINGTGNGGNNVITGTTGKNTLDGGAGADTLIGGDGSDTYVVDASDVVTETGLATDVDTAKSDSTSIDLNNASMFTNLGAVENITLTGTANLNATGDAGANTILGNDGNNVITGGGGVDVLKGGLGNDTYVVNVTAAGALEDTVTETATGGVDSVQLVGSSGAATLVVAATIENFDISGTGSSLLDVTGSASGNILIGNLAANTLKGMLGNDTIDGGNGNDLIVGGGGNDNLTGGIGADSFWFDTAANAATNVDTITDFVSGTDMLQFSVAKYAGIGTAGNPMTAANFVAGTSALDSADRLIYDQASGSLWFDKNGSINGATEQVLVAQLGAGTALTAADIWVV